MSTNLLLITRILLDCIVLVFVIFVIYICAYLVRKYIFEKWITKAVNAAETMYQAPEHTKVTSTIKKNWVVSFLKDNGLNKGFSDNVMDALIEAEVNSIKLKKGKS